MAVLDVTLRHGLSTSVAEALLGMRIPFIAASGGADPVAVAGDAFRGITNLGKPNTPTALIAALEGAMVSFGLELEHSKPAGASF